MVCYSGRILGSDGFYDGYVVIEDGIVTEVGDGIPKDSVKVGHVFPQVTDGHTHVGDAGLRLDRKYSLEELVAPPDGLKHRYLSSTPPERITADIEGYTVKLRESGVGRFLDFREGGVEGARLLNGVHGATIFGRPVSKEFDPNEMDSLLDICDGIGIPSISDMPDSYITAIADAVHRKGKHLAIHVSERIREDIDAVLSLEPDFLIHMCTATDSDLHKCADAGVPVVICASSNLYFDRIPPFKRMVDAGVEFAIGTDNAMLCLPDIFAEARVADEVAKAQGCPGNTIERALLFAGNRLITESNDGVVRGTEAPVITGDRILAGRSVP